MQVIISIIKLIFMTNIQARAGAAKFRCQSAASPLSTAFYGLEIPLSEGSDKSHQVTDIQHIFDV